MKRYASGCVASVTDSRLWIVRINYWVGLLYLILWSAFSGNAHAFDPDPNPADWIHQQIGEVGRAYGDYVEYRANLEVAIIRARADLKACGKCNNRTELVNRLDELLYHGELTSALFKMTGNERFSRGWHLLYLQRDGGHNPNQCTYAHDDWSDCLGDYLYGKDRRQKGPTFPDLTQYFTAHSSCQVKHNELRICRYLKDKDYHVDGKPYIGVPAFDNKVARARPRRGVLAKQEYWDLSSGRGASIILDLSAVHREALNKIILRVNKDSGTQKPLLVCEYRLDKITSDFYVSNGEYYFANDIHGRSESFGFGFWNKVFPLTAEEVKFVPMTSYWISLGREGVATCPKDYVAALALQQRLMSQVVPVEPDVLKAALQKYAATRPTYPGNYRVEVLAADGSTYKVTATIKQAKSEYNDVEYYYVVYSDPKFGPETPVAALHTDHLNLVMGNEDRLHLAGLPDGNLQGEYIGPTYGGWKEKWTRDPNAPTLKTPEMTVQQYNSEQMKRRFSSIK